MFTDGVSVRVIQDWQRQASQGRVNSRWQQTMTAWHSHHVFNIPSRHAALLVALVWHAHFTVPAAGSIPTSLRLRFAGRPCRIQRQAQSPGFHEALALSEARSWQDAAAAWREVLEDPSGLPEALRPHAHCALGDALQKLGRDSQAAEEFATAMRLAPDFAAAALRRGTALRRLGDFRGAEAAYRRVLRRPTGGGKRQATLGEVSQASSGAATAMLRQGSPSRLGPSFFSPQYRYCLSTQLARRFSSLFPGIAAPAPGRQRACWRLAAEAHLGRHGVSALMSDAVM